MVSDTFERALAGSSEQPAVKQIKAPDRLRDRVGEIAGREPMRVECLKRRGVMLLFYRLISYT